MPDNTAPQTLLDRLQTLSEAVGMPGNETAIRKLVREMVTPVADDITVDTVGNLFAFKKGTGARDMNVMVTAHMDEVGFMIVSVDDGLCAIQPVGGIDPRVVIGKPMWVGPGKTPGVVLAKPVHLLTNYTSIPDVDSLQIDIGPKGKASAGDWATFAMPFANLGAVVRGKALDDRLGVAILIELLHGDPFPFDITAAFTVQEEIGLRGARVAAYRVNPDAAIVLEATAANDLPTPHDDDENIQYNTRLFHGPAISIADRATLYQRALVDHFASIARAEGIPFQFRQPGAGGNDAGAIHRVRGGIPTQAISVPTRYLHSPAAVAAIEDIDNTVKLVRAGLQALTPDVIQRQ